MTASASTVQRPPQAAQVRVVIETISYINDMVSHPGQTHAEFVENIRPGDTVRMVLKHFADQHPKLKEALWDPNHPTEIGPHVEIIVNDAILDIHHTLDSSLRDGDRIMLTGQYIGG